VNDCEATLLSDQRYVSKELAHFLGRALPDDDARFSLLVRVLQQGWLTHPPHIPNVSGNVEINTSASLSNNDMYVPQVVCFCDIPISGLAIHTRKYGRFGLTFSKAMLVKQGASPVFYVASSCQVSDPFGPLKIDRLRPQPGQNPHDAIREQIVARVGAASVYDEGERHWRNLQERVEELIKASKTQPGVPREQTELWALASIFHGVCWL
jgi:hypothetical protein